MTESQRRAQQKYIDKALLSHGLALARVQQSSSTPSTDANDLTPPSSDDHVPTLSDRLSSPPPISSLSSMPSSPLPFPQNPLSDTTSLNQLAKPKKKRKSQDLHIASSISSDTENINNSDNYISARTLRKRCKLV